jgi:flagellar capping protein FliD
LTDDQSALDTKRSALEARYTKQFTTMNQIVSEMNSLKDYLDGQLKNLPFTAQNN